MVLSIDLLAWLRKVTYLKSDIDSAVNAKADSDHNHSGVYAPVSHQHTKSQITDFDHTHDDRYYTETEIDTQVSNLQSSINGKASSTHSHSASEVMVDQDTVASKISNIESAISNLQTADWDIKIVSTLPNTGVAGALYFVSNSESGDNQYEEYVYDATNERFEKLGDRTIDLSGYVQISDCAISITDSGILTLTVE